MRESYDQIKDLNTEVLAISTEKPVEIKLTIERLGFEYPVLYDTAGIVPKQFGVEKEGSAIPSTFLLDKTGAIRWEYIGDEHDQASISLIITKLEALKNGQLPNSSSTFRFFSASESAPPPIDS